MMTSNAETIETELAELKAAFREQAKAVHVHFSKSLPPKRFSGETLRSYNTRRAAWHGVSFLENVDYLLKHYENAPFDEDDVRAVIIGRMIVSKAREWELAHIGRSVIPAHVVEVKRPSR